VQLKRKSSVLAAPDAGAVMPRASLALLLVSGSRAVGLVAGRHAGLRWLLHGRLAGTGLEGRFCWEDGASLGSLECGGAGTGPGSCASQLPGSHRLVLWPMEG